MREESWWLYDDAIRRETGGVVPFRIHVDGEDADSFVLSAAEEALAIGHRCHHVHLAGVLIAEVPRTRRASHVPHENAFVV